jgi:hypothetical protein
MITIDFLRDAIMAHIAHFELLNLEYSFIILDEKSVTNTFILALVL